jgi:hypothetical protein
MNSRHPTKHACLTIATVCSLSVIGNSHAEDVLATAIGEAYDLDSAAPLYSETHCQNGDPDARDVVYRDVSGRLIALKTLDYKSGPTTPSFVQKNFYPQESIAVTLQQDTLTMSISSDGDTEPVKRLTTKPDPDLPVVIDAGFDTFVTQHWDKLVAGERHSFQFPFAARETLVELRIKPSSCSYATQTDQCFSLEMNAWRATGVCPISATPTATGWWWTYTTATWMCPLATAMSTQPNSAALPRT